MEVAGANQMLLSVRLRICVRPNDEILSFIRRFTCTLLVQPVSASVLCTGENANARWHHLLGSSYSVNDCTVSSET